MIDVSDAFDDDTTVAAILQTQIAGTWDLDNQWVAGGLSEPVPIRVTPFPAGNVAAAAYGEELKAEFFGERTPEFKRFLSPTEMPINSVITYRGMSFKVIRVGDYKAGGYWEVVGARLLEQT